MSSPNGKPAAGDTPHTPLAFWARGRVTYLMQLNRDPQVRCEFNFSSPNQLSRQGAVHDFAFHYHCRWFDIENLVAIHFEQVFIEDNEIGQLASFD